MSTTWHYVCIDHTPHLHSDEAGTNGRGLERMRELYEHRTELVDAINVLHGLDFDVWNFDRVENVAVQFFRQHPTCRMAAMTWHDEYLELDPPTPPDHPAPLPDPVVPSP